MARLIKLEKDKIRNIRSLVLFELLYKSIFLVVFIPMVSFMVKITLRISGFSYVSLENIGRYLRAPASLFGMALLIVFVAVFTFTEMISLIVYYHSSLRYRKIRVSHVLFPGFYQTRKLLKRKGNFILPFFTMLLNLSFSLPIFLGMLTQQRMPSYILESVIRRSPIFYIAAAFMLLIVFIVFRGIFVIHYCCFDDMSFRQAYKMSAKTIRGNKREIIASLIIYNVLLLVVYVILYLSVVVVSGLVIYSTVKESLFIAVFLTTYDQINRYYAVVVSVLSLMVNCAIITKLFLQYKLTRMHLEADILAMQQRISEEEDYFTDIKGTFLYRVRYGHYTRRVAVLSCIILGVIVAYTATHFDSNVFAGRDSLFRTSITAHRGFSSIAPENSIEAVQLAIDNLSDYVEIDVQETKDGVVVLLHDTNLKRVTGVNKNIWNVTYEELQQYSLGYRFPRLYPESRIPTLEEVLLLCKDKVNLNIEIKINSHEERLCEEVVRLVEKYDMVEECVVSSANYGALERVKALNSDIKTGYIMSLAYGYFYNWDNADFFSVKSTFVTREMIRIAHSYGKGIHAWTVNRIAEIERMKQLGVDNIITDQPVLVREIVYSEGLNSSFLEFLQSLMK